MVPWKSGASARYCETRGRIDGQKAEPDQASAEHLEEVVNESTKSPLRVDSGALGVPEDGNLASRALSCEVRDGAAEESRVGKSQAIIEDICCGVGAHATYSAEICTSTRARPGRSIWEQGANGQRGTTSCPRDRIPSKHRSPCQHLARWSRRDPARRTRCRESQCRGQAERRRRPCCEVREGM